ncbi:glycoside hydrolase family 75 protein [Flavobacterium sp. LS1R49]|uniref:Glycoside hydrolase family 75 protein n=1 Tax=Flavobacterium shii TaxID=2987687 RepID=A0A9X2ZFD4_9FLAO|nr:glycoside hydrolase family 75 protein [Flavobacterium shii]MCV9930376.1 glycoside hydrolase family 75 protein [Flavobacterium shii]
MKRFIITLFIINSFSLMYGQEFKLSDSYVFKPQDKKIKLLENSKNAKIIVFKTNMAINTDGTPLSYHPYDLRADSLALNFITNAVAIYRLSDSRCISIPKKDLSEYPKKYRVKVKFDPSKITDKEKKEYTKLAYKVFEEWRDAGFPEKQIDGYEIIWQNVLVNKNGKPCIFEENKQFKGYFASMTAEDNGIKNDISECSFANQLDPFIIPSIVLNNGIKYGASKGDLVVAYNPVTKIIVYGIVGDKGPGNNLGEGSILLNMKLKGITEIPKGKNAVKTLAISENIMIGIIPKSKEFKLLRPYTETSITDRVKQWFNMQGYSNQDGIIKLLTDNCK